jgi:hypothetical protein
MTIDRIVGENPLDGEKDLHKKGHFPAFRIMPSLPMNAL